MLTALTIHLFHVKNFFVAFLRVSQRAFWRKRFLCELALFSAIHKIFSSWFTHLFISFWDRTPARACGGWGSPVSFPPCLALSRVPPCGRACASGAVQRQGGAGGGGRPVCRPPWGRGRGAPRGGGLLYLAPSLCLPWAGTNAGVSGVAQFMEGVAPILLRFVSACDPALGPWGALLRWCGSACLSLSLWVQAGGGVGASGVRA